MGCAKGVGFKAVSFEAHMTSSLARSSGWSFLAFWKVIVEATCTAFRIPTKSVQPCWTDEATIKPERNNKQCWACLVWPRRRLFSTLLNFYFVLDNRELWSFTLGWEPELLENFGGRSNFCSHWGSPFLRACFFLRCEDQKRALLCHTCTWFVTRKTPCYNN